MAFPDIGSNVARKANPRMMRWARWVLTRLGWRIDGTIPDLKKFVVIGAYHTSNWDFFVAMAVLFALGYGGILDRKAYDLSLAVWPHTPCMRRQSSESAAARWDGSGSH